jgi:hypothetical protein
LSLHPLRRYGNGISVLIENKVSVTLHDVAILCAWLSPTVLSKRCSLNNLL